MARVLIVDDEQSIRTSLGTFARNGGHEVSLASDAAEALSLLKEKLFDVVVTDIILPRKTGVALLADIRGAYPDIQVIMITGEPEVGTAAEAVREGAFDYLSKPVSREDITKTVLAAAEKKALLNKNRLLEIENLRYREHLEGLVEVQTRALRQSKEAADRLLEQQTHINALALALGESSDLPLLYHTIYDHVCDMMDAAVFIVSFYEKDNQLIEAGFVVNEGEEIDASALPAIPVAKEGRGRQSQVIHTGKPLYLADKMAAQSRADTEYTIKTDGEITEGLATEEENIIRSVVYSPMLVAGDVIGVVQVQSHQTGAYSPGDIDLLSGMANVAAIAIQNARLNLLLQNTLEGSIQAIAVATEMRDPYTAGHQLRVSELACAIAEELGLQLDRTHGLRVASLMHDIGKMCIPAEILVKPGTLTDTEFGLIKGHPQAGANILKEIESAWPLADIVLQHHERMNGSGYPNGLKGDAILLEARILSVADVVEAMASHRPYRPALGIDKALEEISKNKGVRYDSEAVDACISLFKQKSFAFSKQ